MPEGILGDEIDSVYATFKRGDRSWSVGVAGPNHVAATIAGLPGESFGDVLDAAVVKLRKNVKAAA
jgi:hypothetical protein